MLRTLLVALVIGAMGLVAPAAEPAPARLLSEPLSPAESMKRLRVLPGFAVDLVASEPLVDSPVAIDWGADGRMWVVEMIDYPMGLDGKGSPGGRVKFLTDSDADGTYDKASVFLDGLRMPTAVAPWRDGVLVAVAGEVLFAADTDNDGKADKVEPLFTGFKEGNPQLRVNGLRWGGDGWVYCASGLSGGNVRSAKTGKELKLDGHDLRINPDTGAMELISGPSQFGRECDDFGNWFGVQNSNPLFHIVLEDRYLRINPVAPPVDPKRQLVTPPNAPVFAISASRNQFDRTQASPGHPGHFTSACGIGIYRDALLFPRGDGVTHAFTCEPVHNLIRHTVLTRDGVSFRASRGAGEEEREFLASTDTWFRPVMTRTGPDGALYVVDMYRYMVEHPDWMPAGGAERMAKLFRAGEGMGRIYRVRREGAAHPAPAKAPPDLAKRSPAEWVEQLKSANGVRRDLAQRLLVWNFAGDGDVEARLLALLRGGEGAHRLAALQTLAAIALPEPETFRLALADADPAVRAAGVRIADRSASLDRDLIAAVAAMADDPDLVVRFRVACSLGRMYSAAADRALANLAVSPGASDPYFAAAVLSSSFNGSTRHHVAHAVARAGPAAWDTPVYRGLVEMLAAGNDRDLLTALLSPVLAPAGADGGFTAGQVLAFGHVLAALDARGRSADAFSPKWKDDLAGLFAKSVPVFDAARRVAADPAAADDVRAAAASVVGHAPDRADADLELLVGLLGPQVPPDVQSAAVKAVARRGGDRAPAMLTSGFAAMSPQTRGEVLDVLLSREAWTVELLREVDAGRIPPQQFDPARRQRLSAHKSQAVRTLAGKLFGGGADATARAKVIEQRRGALSKAGDATRGLRVFTENCAVCHRFGDRGQEVGPDLRSVSAWEPEALLAAVLDPNRLVEPRYLSYNVTLNDGQALFGIITADAAAGVTLKGLDGKEQPVPRAAIKSLVGTNKSLMPDGFEAAMRDQDLADLIAFLKRGGG